ncbi:signal transduction histidine kinase [Desulfovibrio sp. X2]|uniref:sensor histidine kinase n=1 Tax=Desulfovibrio sp. X2 TaxID=941449 RepID=UPI000358C925|nr:histidine kinase dimerization/phosphoacceptor domain -containing protein [Desulfovibrio sp. X2]EPR43915.1 signal transduction histidine kinase [Desulfovibrio sp. X2]
MAARSFLGRSLSRDLSLSLALVVSLVAAAALVLLFASTQKQAEEENEARADSYLTFLQETLRIPMWELNDQAIDEIGRTFAHNEFVEGITIRDADGRVLFSAAHGKGHGVIRRAEITHDGTTIGRVILELNIDAQKAARRTLLLNFAGASLLAVLVLVGVTGILLRVLLRRPFHTLDGLISEYAAGRYDALPPAIPYEEFHPITALLVQMGQTIQSQMERLSEAEQAYRSIFENASEGLARLTPGGRFLSINPAGADILGFDCPEALLARENLHSTDFYADLSAQKMLQDALRTNGEAHGVVAITTARGESRWIEVHARAMPGAGGGHEITETVIIDVTERHHAEMRLAKSLSEKDILLKEIHHRVKNNLQIVSSLLYLQSQGIDDKALRDLFLESQGRIASMALVHEEMYQTHNLSGVDLGEYAKKLVVRLLSTYGKSGVELTAEVARVPVSLETAIPCALILNELVTNACKHAFSGVNAGSLHLCVAASEETVSLQVRDNGPGLPQDFHPEDASTLGMLLISRLTEQIRGRLETGNAPDGGACFTIAFPLEQKEKTA